MNLKDIIKVEEFIVERLLPSASPPPPPSARRTGTGTPLDLKRPSPDITDDPINPNDPNDPNPPSGPSLTLTVAVVVARATGVSSTSGVPQAEELEQDAATPVVQAQAQAVALRRSSRKRTTRPSFGDMDTGSANASDNDNDTRPSKKKSKKKRRLRGNPSPPSAPDEDDLSHLGGLPEHLAEDLDVLFCGINPGRTSATVGHHYANGTNHFWPCLHLSGFTPRQLPANEDSTLPEAYNLGLTNLVERASISEAKLLRREMADSVPALLTKIARWRPRVMCFNGKGIWLHVERSLQQQLLQQLEQPEPIQNHGSDHNHDSARARASTGAGAATGSGSGSGSESRVLVVPKREDEDEEEVKPIIIHGRDMNMDMSMDVDVDVPVGQERTRRPVKTERVTTARSPLRLQSSEHPPLKLKKETSNDAGGVARVAALKREDREGQGLRVRDRGRSRSSMTLRGNSASASVNASANANSSNSDARRGRRRVLRPSATASTSASTSMSEPVPEPEPIGHQGPVSPAPPTPRTFAYGIQPYKAVHDVNATVRETLFCVFPSSSGRVVSHQRKDKVVLFKKLREDLELIKAGTFDTSSMQLVHLARQARQGA